tara:strand:+ start:802 stop:3909 length:3108 start_codon:yes stop_codon:yes gene_type:complete
MKFAHISDTHIRNLKYHKEYRSVFTELYDTLKQQEVDYIIHCGDIAHTKTQISPEFVEMCSEFFRSLAEIAPTYVILGNHDGNLKNSSRQDALSPIAHALNLPNLRLLKNSGETIIDDDFTLNVLSVFDRPNWMRPTDASKINIALYHGSISNCKTDTNWTMEHGEDSIDIFKDFDFGMLGDIHRRQFLDNDGRVWYAGSTVQQNHGETNDKGILIWEIESKDEWEVTPIVFQNPKPFCTIRLTPKGHMPRGLKVPPNARLRVVCNNNLPLGDMRRALSIAKRRFKPESISFLNRAAGDRGSVEDLAKEIRSENLRDIKVQEELMKEYLKGYQLSPEALEKVFELNRKYNKIVEDKEEISRNINWRLRSFEWDNLFNYGEGNSINFDRLKGIIGVFGKNFSGKSSIIDAALYTLFNKTSKNERKNLNVINQNKNECRGALTIDVGNQTYLIERTSEKYTKKLKGEETLEAKTYLNFEVLDRITGELTSLNGNTRNQTDANIRKRFGTVEDFLMSSFASQHGSLTFIDEGSTRRKEIIAKFLDLEFFDQKFKIAKEDSIETKYLLKKHEKRDYDSEIKIAFNDLKNHKELVELNAEKCEVYKTEIGDLNSQLLSLQERIDNIPNEIINITSLKAERSKKNNTVKLLAEKIVSDSQMIDLKKQETTKTKELIDAVNIYELRLKKTSIDSFTHKHAKCVKELEGIKKKQKLLDGIPCGTQFPKCRFIKDAHVAVATREIVEGDIRFSLKNIKELNSEDVEGALKSYDTSLISVRNLNIQISDLMLTRERNKNAKATNELRLRDIESKIEEYNVNKDAIENLERLLSDRDQFKIDIKLAQEKLNTCDEQTMEHVKQVGSCEQSIINFKALIKEKSELHKSFSAYELFMRCMHSNGIAYDLIKKKIPVINQEVARILTNIVDFEILFEASGNKLDIFIKHEKFEARPIEMASGSEKTMAAMAIRLALLSVSSLPKGDLFILDEPGTALDEENMEGFIRILELIKVYFKNVLLVSHLDSLKDCVDMQIVIDKKQGYAGVNQ